MYEDNVEEEFIKKFSKLDIKSKKIIKSSKNCFFKKNLNEKNEKIINDLKNINKK